MSGAAEAHRPASRDFLRRVLPLTLAVWTAGVAASYWQHGFLIGGARGVPLAGPGFEVGLWHLLLLGFAAGYAMALVGGATGLVSLPYDMSVLGFSTIHVSPTIQLETFLNPVGALLGFRRNGQWNGDFAIPLCAGALIGGLLGPFVRVLWLSDPAPFKGVVGVALLLVALQMFLRLRGRSAAPVAAASLPAPLGLREAGNARMEIRTVSSTWRHIEVTYGGENRRMSLPVLALMGCGVGVVSAALGVGGGFLLVPLLAEIYRLPMRVIVAGSIPYVFVLSAAGLFSFNVSIPVLTGHRVPPEWAWGFFTGGAAILGSWYATHSQRHIPETLLRAVLGTSLGVVGLLYVLAYFGAAPVNI